MDEPRRPTHTVIVPGRERLDAVIEAMIKTGQIFTVEPASQSDVWHVGLMQGGVDVIADLLGPVTHIDLGEADT